MTTTTRRAGTQLNVRLTLNRLAKRKVLLVDNVVDAQVAAAEWLGTATDPTTRPDPPRPTDPPATRRSQQRLRLQHPRYPRLLRRSPR